MYNMNNPKGECAEHFLMKGYTGDFWGNAVEDRVFRLAFKLGEVWRVRTYFKNYDRYV